MNSISDLQNAYLFNGIQNTVVFSTAVPDNTLTKNNTSSLDNPDQLFLNNHTVLQDLQNKPLISFSNTLPSAYSFGGLTLTEVSSVLGQVSFDKKNSLSINDINQFKVSSILVDTPNISKVRLADEAKKVAKKKNTTGWCYSGVGEAVAKSIAPFLKGKSAYMAAEQLAKHPKFREIQVSPEKLPKLPAGAIVVWNKTSQSPHGHISVSLGNGYEASDHVQKQMTSLRGSKNYRVFVPIS